MSSSLVRLGTRRVEGLVHVKSVQAQSPRGVEVRRGSAGSGVIFIMVQNYRSFRCHLHHGSFRCESVGSGGLKKTLRIERLIDIKSVESRSLNVGVVWKLGEWDAGSGESHSSLMAKVMDSWLACHEFESSTAEEGRCTLNMSRFKCPPFGVVWKIFRSSGHGTNATSRKLWSHHARITTDREGHCILYKAGEHCSTSPAESTVFFQHQSDTINYNKLIVYESAPSQMPCSIHTIAQNHDIYDFSDITQEMLEE
ncbi:hypothetical protein TNCV_635121 [Trichonephila clavipes]|nr:hypothetical protein TNCV_635121 [Trichonephila clavipes]